MRPSATFNAQRSTLSVQVMNDNSLTDILEAVQSGKLSVQEAVGRLRHLPYEDLGFAKVDHHRSLRTGFPEAIFCQGKSSEQVVEIVKRLAARNPVVLATRADEQMYEAVGRPFPVPSTISRHG